MHSREIEIHTSESVPGDATPKPLKLVTSRSVQGTPQSLSIKSDSHFTLGKRDGNPGRAAHKTSSRTSI